MDVFRIYLNLGANVYETVTGVEDMIWVERYNQPGEFVIVGDPVPLQEQLPLGAYVSHSLSQDIMVVESHFIDESKYESPKVEITGRCLSTYIMDHRVVSFRQSDVPAEIDGGPVDGDIWNEGGFGGLSIFPMAYDLGALNSWEAVQALLYDHLVNPTATLEAIENLEIVIASGLGAYSDGSPYRITKKLTYLSEAVYSILKAADIGLKVLRPGPNRKAIELAYDSETDFSESIFFYIYHGSELWESVFFNFNNGDISNARYSWSIKNEKNAVYSGNLSHTYREYFNNTVSGWNTKCLKVDANDYTPDETADTEEIKNYLYGRGRDSFFASGANGVILDALGTQNAGPKYLFDYDLGAKVSVLGNYGVSTVMRVNEVAFIKDKKDGDMVIPVLVNPYTTYELGGVG